MTTTNYDLFSFKKENRGISRQKINQLKDNFITFGFDENYPVLIDQNFLIIDGQHRFTACKELKIPIIYSFSKHDSNEYMRSLNIVSSAWELSDYIKSYSSEGIECYVKLLEFKKNHQLNITNAIVVFFGNQGKNAKNIRLGVDISINPNCEKIAIILKKFLLLKFNSSKNFVLAIQSIVNKGVSEKNMEYLIQKQLLITEMASISQYLVIFQNLLNNRRGQKQEVFFV